METKIKLGKREKQFLRELKNLGGTAALYEELAPRVFYVVGTGADAYTFASKIASRLEEKGLVKNIYGKRRKRYVTLTKDIPLENNQS